METLTRKDSQSRLRRDWSKEAIALALKGEWERAAEVNQAILALFSDDVEAMNRLGKALMELSRYERAREVLDEVVVKAPYNAIARKNLARLGQLESIPVSEKLVRKTASVPQLFIAESGKSGTTTLQRTAAARVAASVAPGEPVTLRGEQQCLRAYIREDEYLGQVEPKLARRLLRLMDGGNRYEAAVIGVNDWGVSIIIREAYRHPSLHNISSFPAASRGEYRVYLDNELLRYLEDGDFEEEDEEEEEEGGEYDGEVDGDWDD